MYAVLHSYFFEGFIVKPPTLNNCKWCQTLGGAFLCGNETVVVAMRSVMKSGQFASQCGNSLPSHLRLTPIQDITSDCGRDAAVHSDSTCFDNFCTGQECQKSSKSAKTILDTFRQCVHTNFQAPLGGSERCCLGVKVSARNLSKADFLRD